MIEVVILFLIVSVVLSLVGLGGGAFYLPVLLAVGYGFQDSSTMSLFLIMLTGFSAFSRFQKADLVDWQLAIVMDLFTDIGAFIGGLTSNAFHDENLKILFALLLIGAAILLLKMQSRSAVRKNPKTGFGYWKRSFGSNNYSIYIPAIIPITFAIGYFSGLLGVAGGILKIPIMVLWFGVPAKITVATSSLMVGLTGLLGFGGHLFNISFDWGLAAILGITVVIGGQIGSKISIGLPEKKVKKILSYIFLLLAFYILINSLLM